MKVQVNFEIHNFSLFYHDMFNHLLSSINKTDRQEA